MKTPTYEWMARFASEEALVDAIVRLRDEGIDTLEASTPYESELVLTALDRPRSRIPFVAFGIAVVGGLSAWGIEWWTRNVSFPVDVGGRPRASSWADLPIVFETTILSATIASFVACIVRARLPRLRHPWFAVEGFDEGGFWLAVSEASRERLLALGATRIERVEHDRAEGDEIVEEGSRS